jgi:hypothetical protein
MEEMGASKSPSGRKASGSRVSSGRKSSKGSSNSANSFPIKRTLANGDCLFSAVFRALRDKNLLDKFNNCYEDFGNDEKTFIKNLRIYLSNDYYLLNQYSDMFVNIVNNFKTDKNYSKIFKQILKDMGDVRKILLEYKKNKMFDISNVDNFIEDVKKEIRKEGSYTGQFEVDVIEVMITNCSISIELYRNKEELINDLKYVSDNIRNRNIFLLLRNQHWEYI